MTSTPDTFTGKVQVVQTVKVAKTGLHEGGKLTGKWHEAVVLCLEAPSQHTHILVQGEGLGLVFRCDYRPLLEQLLVHVRMRLWKDTSSTVSFAVL